MTTATTAPESPPASAQSVTVNIYDNAYQLRGTDPAHIQKLADLVDSKMRAVAHHGTTVDSLRVAVLAALNIADEMVTMQARHDIMALRLSQAETTVKSRTQDLSGLLDSVLRVG